MAAVVMLQGHVFHSFTAREWREGSAYQLSQFVGGMPPAIFLFLTGVTMAFLLDSLERKGLGLYARWTAGLRRAGYLLLLAYAFRVQLWVFGQPSSPWTDLFKVDILNCMGVGLALVSVMTLFNTRDRARLSALLGFTIASLSPLVSALGWSEVPAFLKAYFAPDYDYFGLFPWAAFLAFGVSVGSLLRLVKPDHHERMMQWLALAGFGLILGARYAANLPYSVYNQSQFWLDSPALTLIKLGLILLLLAFGFTWNRYVIPGGWNWLRQMGTTSLLIYWVHIELVYGRWFWFWKENLNVSQTTAAASVTIALMVGLSVGKTHWERIKAWLFSPNLPPPEPQVE